jgi:autotransporter-associated beta strand protein
MNNKSSTDIPPRFDTSGMFRKRIIPLSLALAVVGVAMLAMSPGAGAATEGWTGASSDLWSDSTNWAPPTNPPATGDDVIFDVSARTTTSVNGFFSLASATFNPGAPAYTNNILANKFLTVTGTGIVNNSASQQKLVALPAGNLAFRNSATAGNSNVQITTQGYTSPGGDPGAASFYDSATAGSASIVLNGGSLFFSGSYVQFFNGSTAGTANIAVNAGTTSTRANGQLYFYNNSTAASATINTNGGNVNNAYGGSANFGDSATASQALINNNGGTANNGYGGSTQFGSTSTAASATIDNRSGTVGGAYGGSLGFTNSALAGTAVITNRGSAFNRNLHSNLGFNPNGGLTAFNTSASADHAAITNEGGSVSGARGGSTEFLTNSTAGNATITTAGGTVSGASGGQVLFWDSASAGNAIITTQGGVSGAGGGNVLFVNTSDGGSARAITNSGGTFSIAGLSSSGMQIGSIEGGGTYDLGSKTLTAGNNNLSTSVSGVIQGDGGALVKVGAGTLTLNGANTYTGGTTIYGGTLGGTGSIAGSLTVASGGHVAPGASAGILTVSGPTIFNSGSIFDIELGGTTAGNGTGNYDQLSVLNTATVNGGTLNVNLINGFTPHVGDLFEILTSTALTVGTPFAASLPQAPTGAAWEVRYRTADSQNIELALVSAGVQGDYNHDGKVDPADYVLWRKNPSGFGGNPAGYNAWRSNFGTGAGSGSALGAASVPEPTTGTVIWILGSAFLLRVRRRWAA